MSLRKFISRLSQCSRLRKKQHKNKKNNADNNNKHREMKGNATAIRVVDTSSHGSNGLFKGDIRIIVTPASSRSVSEAGLWVPDSSECEWSCEG